MDAIAKPRDKDAATNTNASHGRIHQRTHEP